MQADAPWITPWRFAALLGLAFCLSYPEILFGARSFVHRDFGVIGYPTVFYHREAFWNGELPLWNPLSNCGVPFLAQWGTMVLYPGALLYLVLPVPWSLNVFCLLHLWLGGVGMYLLAWRWSGSRFGAAVAGTAFALGGLAQACLLWPNYTVALGWLPWVLSGLERARQQGGQTVAVAALAASMQVLAGVPELVLITWGVAGLALVADVAAESRAIGRLAWAPVRRYAGAACLMLGLTAVQTLPFIELLTHSQRLEVAGAPKWSLPWSGLANLVAPWFACQETVGGTWLHPEQQFLESLYLGPGLLTLALAGLIGGRPARGWLLAGSSVGALVLALGEATPLGALLWRVLPGLGLVRYPVKFALVLNVTLPLLAALTLAQFPACGNSAQRGLPWKVLGAGLAVLALILTFAVWDYGARPVKSVGDASRLNAVVRALLFVLVGGTLLARLRCRSPRLIASAGLAWLALMLVDYRTHLPRLNPTAPPGLLEPGLTRSPGLPVPGEGRVFITPAAEAALLESSIANLTNDYLGKRLAQWSHLNLLDGVAKVNGSATLRLAEQAALQRAIEGISNAVELPLLDFLGVTHATSATNVTDWRRRPAAMPLVAVGSAPQWVPLAETISAVLAPSFDPRRTVLLEAEPTGGQPRFGAGQAFVTNLVFALHQVEFDVAAEDWAIATVAQSYYPAWQAWLDDREVRLLRANGAFQALEVPPGTHRVRLRYVDNAFRFGLAVTCFSAATCFWVLGPTRARRRRP